MEYIEIPFEGTVLPGYFRKATPGTKPAKTLIMIGGGETFAEDLFFYTRDRFDYNTSIAESWKRQILLNIVKMRYLEPVSFMDVGQIVAGYSLESGVSLGDQLNFNSTAFFNSSLTGK